MMDNNLIPTSVHFVYDLSTGDTSHSLTSLSLTSFHVGVKRVLNTLRSRAALCAVTAHSPGTPEL
jgi:hypothetical protein